MSHNRIFLLFVGFTCISVVPAVQACAAPLTFTVVPLKPLIECPPHVAEIFTGRLKEHLVTRGVRVASREAVGRALRSTRSQSQFPVSLDAMLRVGKETKADRVIQGSISLQAKVVSQGEVWEIEVDEVDVAKGEKRGSFKRVSAFGRYDGERQMGGVVDKILKHNPSAPGLVMRNPAPMPAPDGSPREVGMAYVPAGEFIMGSDRGEVDEEPRHVVDTDAFFIDLHEVTNAEYDRCVAAWACEPSTTRTWKEMNAPNQPVAGVGFEDAEQYCAFAGKRLLTEAEWEKAARGTDERAYPWGNDWDIRAVNQAWAGDGFAFSAPVGSFAKNVSPYGVFDMAGNVWEWTADLHDPNYYRVAPRKNPRGPDKGDHEARRVMRGGSFMYDVPFIVTTPNRSPGRPWVRKMWVGIRCGKDAP